jgi:hypothetical protein
MMKGVLKLIPLSAPSAILRNNSSKVRSTMVRAGDLILADDNFATIVNYVDPLF